MPRPIKERNVCCLPKSCTFGPLNSTETEVIFMTVDEYECIRLIDLKGCTQEECAERMTIARSTVQMIYNEAPREAPSGSVTETAAAPPVNAGGAKAAARIPRIKILRSK